MTQGDRRSTVPILDDYINDTNEILGVAILKHLLESVSQDDNKLLNKLLKIGVFKIDNDDIKLASCSRNSRGFFNRLLGLKIKDQKKIYEKFLDSKELVMNQIPADTDINRMLFNLSLPYTDT